MIHYTQLIRNNVEKRHLIFYLQNYSFFYYINITCKLILNKRFIFFNCYSKNKNYYENKCLLNMLMYKNNSLHLKAENIVLSTLSN